MQNARTKTKPNKKKYVSDENQELRKVVKALKSFVKEIVPAASVLPPFTTQIADRARRYSSRHIPTNVGV